MDLRRSLCSVLVAAPVLAVPAFALAQDPSVQPDPDLRIVAPAPFAPCYSPTKVFSGEGDTLAASARIPSISLTGGDPGATFYLRTQGNATGQTLGSNGQTPGTGTFDASGNATVTDYPISTDGLLAQPMPGQRFDLTVTIEPQNSPTAQTTGSRTQVGTVTATGYGIGYAGRLVAGRKTPVAVSGVPLANKVLYLFLTNPRSGKQLSRVKLGKADGCGYLKGNAVVIPKGYRGSKLPNVYVNAGPKLDTKTAVRPTDQ